MVFGQPRQEELMFSLIKNRNFEFSNLDAWLIFLKPPTICQDHNKKDE
jgi:hypothetical protein